MTALAVLASFAGVVVLARFVTRRHVSAIDQPVRRPIGPGGVLVGAEPLHLVGTTDRGMLLLHGFNDTPQSVAQMARALHERGWSVSVPLLPHHGRGSHELERYGRADEWIAHARTEWDALRRRAPRAVLAGQSMGGAIAVILASENAPEALVLLAPYLAMNRFVAALARVWPAWQLFVPQLVGDPRRGLRDPEARAQALGGGRFTPRLVRELHRVVRRAQRELGRLTVPTLVIHARIDYRIPSKSAGSTFARIGSTDKTLIWRDQTGHVLAADAGREGVYAIVADWLESKLSAR